MLKYLSSILEDLDSVMRDSVSVSVALAARAHDATMELTEPMAESRSVKEDSVHLVSFCGNILMILPVVVSYSTLNLMAQIWVPKASSSMCMWLKFFSKQSSTYLNPSDSK